MTDDPRRTKNVQSGPRSQRILSSVREATLQELIRVGYAQMTMGSVAKAAGVHRATIYRRWPTKADLVQALMEPQLDLLDAAPSTGDLVGDLVGLMGQLAHNLASPEGQALSRVMMSTHPELEHLATQSGERARAAFARAFQRALDRGELPADADVEVLLHLAFFGAVHWVMDKDAPPSEATCRRLMEAVLGGAGRGASGGTAGDLPSSR